MRKRMIVISGCNEKVLVFTEEFNEPALDFVTNPNSRRVDFDGVLDLLPELDDIDGIFTDDVTC